MSSCVRKHEHKGDKQHTRVIINIQHTLYTPSIWLLYTMFVGDDYTANSILVCDMLRLQS